MISVNRVGTDTYNTAQQRPSMCIILGTCNEACPWWRHQGESFSALLGLCAGKSPVTRKFPSQRPMTRSFEVFFDLCLNKRLSKQSWGWWFETPSCSLWRHCNVVQQSLLWLILLCTFLLSNFCHSFEDMASVNYIYVWLVFKWAADTWLNDWLPG